MIEGHKGGKMFKLHSNFKPTGDQPEAIEYLAKRNRRGQEIPDTARSYGIWKNIHNGKHNTKSAKTNIDIST